MGSYPIEEWEAGAATVAARLHRGGLTPMAANGMAELDPELASLVQVLARGRFYADDVVDLKTRALCTMACLVAIGEQPYIENWMTNAITAGSTVEEITSLLGQLFVYVGTPRAVTAYDALVAVRDRLAAEPAS